MVIKESDDGTERPSHIKRLPRSKSEGTKLADIA